MQFPTQFPFLVIPTGAGPGQQRITINFNQDGKIKVYDSNGNLVDSLGGPKGEFLIYDTAGNMVISLASAQGTDPVSGATFFAGISSYATPPSTSSINLYQDHSIWVSDDSSEVDIEVGGATASMIFLPYNNGTSWFGAEINTTLDISNGVRPALDVTSPIKQGDAKFANIRFVGGGSPDTSSLLMTADDFQMSGEFSVYNNGSFHSWTPTLTSATSVTYTTQFGWYLVFGKICLFGFYIVVNAAGTGTNIVGMNAPLAIERTGRQAVAFNGDAITGFSGTNTLLSLTGTSGAQFERIRSSTGSNLLANLILSGTVFSGVGMYRIA